MEMDTVLCVSENSNTYRLMVVDYGNGYQGKYIEKIIPST